MGESDNELAEVLVIGLEKIIAEGFFQKLFLLHHARILKDSNLENRTVIELENPLLPPETPLKRKELWYKPE